MKFQPDLVILFFLEENDIRDISKKLSGDVRLWTEFQNGLSKLVEKSRYNIPFSKYSKFLQWAGTAFGKFTKRHIHRFNEEIKGEDTIPPDNFVYLKKPLPEWEKAWRKAFSYLTGMDELCRLNDSRFSLATIGSRMNVYPDEIERSLKEHPYMKELEWDFSGPEKKVESFCGEKGIPFYSLGKVMAEDYKKNKTRFEFRGDGHWNEKGHELVSKAISGWIIKDHLMEKSIQKMALKEKFVPGRNVLDRPLSFNDLLGDLERTERFLIIPSMDKDEGLHLLWKTFVMMPPVELGKGSYQVTLKARGVLAGKTFPRIQMYLFKKPFAVKKETEKVEIKEDPYLFHYNFLKHSPLYSLNLRYLLFIEKASDKSFLKDGLLLMDLTLEEDIRTFTSPVFNVEEKGNFFLYLSYPNDGRAYYMNGVIEDRRAILEECILMKEKTVTD